MVSPSAAVADVNLKVSLPAPPLITLTALLAVMVSLPEPVLTFSMPQSVSLPVWRARRACRWTTHRSQVDGDVRSRRRHVERRAEPPLVAEVDVVAVANLRHDQIVSGTAEDRIVTRSGRDQIVALIAEDAIRAGIAVNDVGVRTGKHLVVAGSGEDHVPASAAADEIAALSGRDRIGAAACPWQRLPRKGDDVVGAVRTHQHVRLRRAGFRRALRRQGGLVIHITADLRPLTTRDVRDAVIPIGRGWSHRW